MIARLGPLLLDFEWRITLLVTLLLPVFVALGFWQLDREDEKRGLAEQFARRQAAAPADLSMALSQQGRAELAYRPVRLSGSFVDGQYLLLDNRIQGGRFGYEVVALFALESGGYALVNRGWIAADPARRVLPDVPSIPDPVTLTGYVYVPPDPPYLLGEQSRAVDDWPRVVQALEAAPITEALSSALAAPVFPWSVRVDALSVGALSVNWQVINVSPAKHRGYAVQWFMMAAVLGLFFLFRSSNLGSLLRYAKR